MAMKKAFTVEPHKYVGRYADDPTYCDYPGCSYSKDVKEVHIVSNRIVIERRELIGEVIEGSGNQSMITAAFQIVGDYLSEHDDPGGIELTFEAFGRTYKAGMLPTGEGYGG